MASGKRLTIAKRQVWNKDYMYNTVLFDLDGTLLDTSKGIVESLKYTIDYLKLPDPDSSNLLSFVGPPVNDVFKKEYLLSDIDAKHAENIFREHYSQHNLFNAAVYPGIMKLFDLLVNRNIRIGIASYKPHDLVHSLLQHFNLINYCNAITGSNAGLQAKSDIIDKCLYEIGAINVQAIYVGDTEFDAVGAKKSNIPFIGITWGFGFKNKDDVMKYDNIGQAKDVEELINQLSLIKII